VVAAGGIELHVESTLGFDVGAAILIEGGGNSETGVIASIGSIMLADGLTNSYPIDSTVTLHVTPTTTTTPDTTIASGVATMQGTSCVGDSTSWDAGYGVCDTYGSGETNHAYCAADVDDGIVAEDVCFQCGSCALVPTPEVPTPAPTCEDDDDTIEALAAAILNLSIPNCGVAKATFGCDDTVFRPLL
jgi:hypothetical protein